MLGAAVRCQDGLWARYEETLRPLVFDRGQPAFEESFERFEAVAQDFLRARNDSKLNRVASAPVRAGSARDAPPPSARNRDAAPEIRGRLPRNRPKRGHLDPGLHSSVE